MPVHPLKAEAWPFLAGAESAPTQAIGLTWEGEALAPAEVLVDGRPQPLTWNGQSGQPDRATIMIPFRDEPHTIRLSTGENEQVDCAVEPPPRWELFLVPHSHVDIGYTEYQDILADAHGDYIAQALAIMTATDHLLDEQQYRWTCEATWTVEHFLRRHPNREQEFVRRVCEGRMEVTALYVNLTDLFGETLLKHSLRYAEELRDRHAIEIVSACNYDVNGFGWILPALFKQLGVKYLDTAINETRSLGVRPRPAAFQWLSPDGSDVLLWHSSSYLLGNKLQLHDAIEPAEPRVAQYLNTVRRDGYPHWGMQILLSGFPGDSMPPSAEVCSVVAAWNRKWLAPKLRLATVRQWFEHLEAHWPSPIISYQKAWPDWWADGNGSAIYESALVRRTQLRLADLELQRDRLRQHGLNLDRLDDEYATAWRQAMLFAEHTWGAYETGVRPDGTASRGQWHRKASFVYAAAALADSIQLEQMIALASEGKVSARANGMTNATLQGAPAGYLATPQPAAVIVFNPLPDVRTDIIDVHVPGHFVGGQPRLRDAVTGEIVPACVRCYPAVDMVNTNHVRVEFVAADLPPLDHRVYWLEAGETNAPLAVQGTSDTVVENAFFRVSIDRASGAICSILHKPSNRELVQQGADYLLNQCVYEQVESAEDRQAIASWRGLGKRDVRWRRTTPELVQVEVDRARAGGVSLITTAAGANGMTLTSEIVLYDHTDRVDIVNTLDKSSTTRAEGLYHAFPLATSRGQIYLEVAGGVMRPGLDQVPGTTTDWHGIQGWFAVAEPDYAIVVASPDVPLVQCTGINTGLWHESMPASNGLVMSWVLNNYWFTNFPLRQDGQVQYRYSIALQQGPFDPEQATHFAAQICNRAWGLAARISHDTAGRLAS